MQEDTGRHRKHRKTQADVGRRRKTQADVGTPSVTTAWPARHRKNQGGGTARPRCLANSRALSSCARSPWRNRSRAPPCLSATANSRAAVDARQASAPSARRLGFRDSQPAPRAAGGR
eukprot:10493509-Lingulodinium_polyedra.AAC.1